MKRAEKSFNAPVTVRSLGMTVQVDSVLPASAERVWDLLVSKNTFLYITRGATSYTRANHWPETLFSTGAKFAADFRMFGWLPAVPHEVLVVSVDEVQRQIITEESGRLITLWEHHMSVEALSDAETRYTDRIVLQAGRLTPVLWLLASSFYRYRQRRWKSLLRECSKPQRPSPA